MKSSNFVLGLISSIRYKILILFIFVLCPVVYSQQLSEEQKFLKVKNQKVEFLFDTWKYNFGWKTLGGGYVRYLLLITKESIVEIELPEVSNTPGYSSSRFVDIDEPSDILLNLLFLPLIEFSPDYDEKIRQELQNELSSFKQSPTVENFVNFISDLYSKKGEEVKVRNIYFRANIKDLKLKTKGDQIHLSFNSEGKKHSYISTYKNFNPKNEVLLSLGEVLGIEGKTKKEVAHLKPSDFAKEAWYIEVFGNTFVGSVNIDYRFHPNFNLRFGASYMIFGFGFPIMLNFITGKESPHHLELGAGIVSFIGGSGEITFGTFQTLTFGYRYQPKKGGVVFRISFTPLFNFPDKGEVWPWAGISIGYAK